MTGRYANGKSGGGGMFYKGCVIVTLLTLLGLSIATTVGVFKGFSALAPMSPKSFGIQPSLCGGPIPTQCEKPEICCGGMCRNLETFKGVCQDTPPADCDQGTPCSGNTFCCQNGHIGSESGTCRPFDWPGQCGQFVSSLPIKCGEIKCSGAFICCHGICRDPGHPACK